VRGSGKHEWEAGDYFLTTRGSLGGRESGGGDDEGEDRHRRPEFKDGGGGFVGAARDPAKMN
jgi:hypothetical protein